MFKAFKAKYRTLNTVRIFEDALKHNLNLFRKNLPNQSICPVFKSNAYGHGLKELAQILEPENLDFMIVDSLYEAYELQKTGIKTPILILGYTFPENLKKSLPFHFTAADLETAKTLAKLNYPVHLEIDTGMARMGFSMETLQTELEQMKKMDLNIVGVFTHFADADNKENSYTKKQIDRFKKALEMIKDAGFQPKWIHAANSAGAFKADHPEFNMLRLGFSLYGISPYAESDHANSPLKELKPALEVSSTLIAIRKIKKGDKVSYGCTFEAEKDMTIAVIPFGYYEGLPRSLSAKGHLEVNGAMCPIIGRICMNHTIIDLGNTQAKIGDEVIIYSREIHKQNSLSSQAKKADTIPYELMTRIAESVRREIV